MVLNDAGRMVQCQWSALSERFHNMEINEYIMMPNHFHGIIKVTVGAPLVGDLPENVTSQKGQPQGIAPTVGDVVVGAFKSIITREYIAGVNAKNWRRFKGKLWQRNYWEHIVRNEDEYCLIAEYINNNPINWDKDKLNKDVVNQIMESSPNYGNGRCEKIELYEE